ncbi:hypothetical protein EUTSA_v10018666mg [Eutrema salsugineum]|uniref:Uncharacterized protein n=1 Tax=Eutrema salsugineum TaxID=72664 RepID=V4M7V7_EUTSA|nr:uncharacterized serine-rich protein C215.13 [Eutrema salsugineum]ESQ27211.1 hypothetical protein EUTSA_v10018666mg [Eutrema salsugineum]
MASACVNNVGVSQEFPAYGCFNPRASFSREDSRTSGSEFPPKLAAEEAVGAGEFEFRLEDPVGMLPADELFSDGKLATKHQTVGKCRRMDVEMEISGADNCLFSPKAPRCSSRWRELLGLKRFSQNSKAASTTTTLPSNPRSSTSSSLKQFLHRSSRSSSSSGSSSSEASLLSLPLLKDSDCESLSLSSSRMSLSSSSSGHDHEDIPRLSLDAERPSHMLNLNHNLTANPFAPARSLNPNPPRMRLVKPRDSNHGSGGRVGRSPMRRSTGGETCQAAMSRGVSVDSPRLNSSGKIVFQSLERSSSSPSSFNGGTSGYRHRGMERSYSANVRVTPVLNVPVCSIRGGSVIFGQFFSASNPSSSASSQHNRTGSGSNNNRASSHHPHGGINRGRNSTDRI